MTLVGKDQVRHQHRLEGVVQVWNESEIIQRDESNQLHVLNNSPEREESDATTHKDGELEPDSGT